MKRQSKIALSFVLLLAFLPAVVHAQARGIGLISRSTAQSAGLERAWFAQVNLDPSRDRVDAIVLYQPGGMQDFVGQDEEEVDDTARPDLAAGVAANAASDQSVDVDDVIPSVPPANDEALMRPTVYVLTRNSVLQSIDAESGKSNWSKIIGNPRRPSQAPTINRRYVAMVNGSDLFVLDRKTGETLWELRLGSAPISPVAMSANWLYVPSTSGMLTAYHIDDPKNRWEYASGAPVEHAPVVTNDTIAWMTHFGRLFMAEKSTTRVTRRFDGTDLSASPPVYWPPYIYVATLNGYINAIHERSGAAIWRFSSGSPIYEPTVAIDDNLFVVTSHGGLFSLDSAGAQNWYRPGITQFLSASPARVYGVNETNELVVLDRLTGSPIGAISVLDQQVRMVNVVNDRIYVCTEKGLLQCLHEIGQEEPAVHTPPEQVDVDDTDGGGTDTIDG